MSRNQRRHQRVKPKAMSSRVRVAGALHIGLAVENLSLGGAFVRCAQTPPLKTHASLELTVPGVIQPLILHGKVAFTVPLADAQKKSVSPGFAIEFTRPLPHTARLGLERLLGTIDPNAVIPVDSTEDSRTQTLSLPEFALPPAEKQADDGALATLRKLVAAQEREIARLRAENLQLKDSLRLARAR